MNIDQAPEPPLTSDITQILKCFVLSACDQIAYKISTEEKNDDGQLKKKTAYQVLIKTIWKSGRAAMKKIICTLT